MFTAAGSTHWMLTRKWRTLSLLHTTAGRQESRLRTAHCTAQTMDAIGVLNTNPLDDYELIHRIGSGTYGDVFKVHAVIGLSYCQRDTDKHNASDRQH